MGETLTRFEWMLSQCLAVLHAQVYIITMVTQPHRYLTSNTEDNIFYHTELAL